MNVRLMPAPAPNGTEPVQERAFWLIVRRALLMMVGAIDQRFGFTPKKQ